MKKKLLITLAICMLVALTLALCVGAEEAVCEHSLEKWTVELSSKGFLGDITASSVCTTCKETVTETIPSLFITLGYSSSPNGVLQGYGINRPAIERYEELSGEKIKFGGVVALKDSLDGKNPLDADGKPINELVKSNDYTETDISIVDVAIKNIPNEYKDKTELLCALYVCAGGRVTYIDNCAEKVSCGTKTFNEIKEVPKVDTTVLDKSQVIEGKRYHQMTIEEMGLVARKYWNSKSSYTTDDTSKKFFGTNSFTSKDLPNGTIIYIKNDEWQYRPHKYNDGDFKRPDTTKAEYTVIDDSWWADLDGNGVYSNVGFNISYYKSANATNDISKLNAINEKYTVDEVAEIFKIFVPITYSENAGGSDNEGNTGNEGTGNEGTGNEGGTTVIPPSTDYSDQKQNWQDDNTLKILAIGNSFSDDTMDYVYQVAKDAGVENIVLGKLYIGGCSLATHLANAKSMNSAYDYKINTSGTWTAKGNQSIQYAVESDDWDFITFQQVSGYSGVADSYDDLYELVNIVEPLNPSARLAWNMTWAYKTDSSHADFAKYNKDQMTMYNAIVNAVNTKILIYDKIDFVIPAGTSVQNIRTSFIGDVTRDGYHLSYGIGRYIAAMTLVKALTGLSIDNSITRPDDVDSYELKAIIECVNNAIKTPYAVTNSTYVTMDGGTGYDDSQNVGVIPEGYVQLSATQMGLTFASYYNTTGSSAWENTGDTFARGFMATKKFTREQLPVGSIIEIAVGWQYRPEGWKFANTRPDNVTTVRIVIDEEWWGSYSERGFNISQVGHTTNNHMEITLSTTEVANTIFKIIVPKAVAPEVDEPETPIDPNPDVPETEEPDTPVVDEKVYVSSSDCDEAVVVINGKEYRALSKEAMGLIANAYYFSTSDKYTEIYETGTSGTPSKFFATTLFYKTTLPNGAVIWVNSGWQYRPEGWIDENTKNNGEGDGNGQRPKNVSTTYVTIDEAWWRTFTIRGFNISKTNGNSLVGTSDETVYENFKIYIPVENIKD
ncbi:MAG: DUF4886 domain-containing protein [Clostridia bacterium]|nr:DUF4886 domain-containing protein [Clostridia bacterium]